jgi:hypothetical protein
VVKIVDTELLDLPTITAEEIDEPGAFAYLAIPGLPDHQASRGIEVRELLGQAWSPGSVLHATETYFDPDWLHTLSAEKLTGVVPVAAGGTGADTANEALVNLGVLPWHFDLGDDAPYDLYYRDTDGLLARLPLGPVNTLVTSTGSGLAWAPSSGGVSGLTPDGVLFGSDTGVIEQAAAFTFDEDVGLLEVRSARFDLGSGADDGIRFGAIDDIRIRGSGHSLTLSREGGVQTILFNIANKIIDIPIDFQFPTPPLEASYRLHGQRGLSLDPDLDYNLVLGKDFSILHIQPDNGIANFYGAGNIPGLGVISIGNSGAPPSSPPSAGQGAGIFVEGDELKATTASGIYSITPNVGLVDVTIVRPLVTTVDDPTAVPLIVTGDEDGGQTGDLLQLRQFSFSAPWVSFDKDGYGFPLTATFSLPGPQLTGTNVTTVFIMPYAGKIMRAMARCETAPTGAALIFDLNKNGTSIWNATQANRIKINANDTAAIDVTAFDTTTFVRGDSISIDVDQIGSVQPGADVTVTLVCLTNNQFV